MSSKKSINVPLKTVADLLFKSNLQCCICQGKGEHIHHLNDKFNHKIDNLSYVCFKHHDEATKTGGLSRKLDKETIIKFREHHYQVIKNIRQKELEEFDHSINALTEEKLLISSKNALIIIELENIKEQYFADNSSKREKILRQIYKFSNHSNHRVALEIIEFLSIIAVQTGSSMTEEMASTIFDIVLDFSPSLRDSENRNQAIQLAKKCIQIGSNIAYDSFIHVRNPKIAMWGLLIIKYIYRSSKENDLTELMYEVKRTYDELESILNRQERNDLEDAKEILNSFKVDLNIWDLAFPILNSDLMGRIKNLQKEIAI